MMKKCNACGQVKDENCFSSKNHYCRNCQEEMYKLGLKATEYRKYLTKQPKIENTCGGIVARWVNYAKPGERRWQIENIAAGISYAGDDRKEFLAVLHNQLAGE